jgi:hypothetical protein
LKLVNLPVVVVREVNTIAKSELRDLEVLQLVVVPNERALVLVIQRVVLVVVLPLIVLLLVVRENHLVALLVALPLEVVRVLVVVLEVAHTVVQHLELVLLVVRAIVEVLEVVGVVVVAVVVSHLSRVINNTCLLLLMMRVSSNSHPMK